MDLELSKSDEVDAPKSVRASPSLKGDLEALSYLFGPTGVPEVRIRSKAILTIVYGFGDASGTGLGATFTCEGGFNFRIGVWGSAENPESSNWKEFTNIVESLEDEARSGNLADSEVYMFTDNSTVESCAARGSSSSPKLLRLVIRLHGLMTRSGVKIHIFHVAGTRMIAQGTDGVSRGYLGQGVMAGESMVAYIPVHVSAVERSPIDLVPWIRSWSGKDTRLLEPEGWFESGHDIEGWRRDEDGFERPILSEGRRRSYIWSPPPLAAEVAIAELRKARIKRQDSCHIFVCPRLCTTQWAKQLYRTADIVFELPVGFSCWPTEMHEPLLIGILFPFLRVKPWQIKGTPKMFAVGRQLRGLLQESEMESGNILRKLWSLCGDLPSMPSTWCGSCYSSDDSDGFFIATGDTPRSGINDEDRLMSGWVPRKVDAGRFTVARDGDDLMVSFECDFCIFWKLYNRSPDTGDERDQFVMRCIRRINLDAFWSRARSTVEANAAKIREGLKISNKLGLPGPYLAPGPLPRHDHCGYQVALQIVVSSLESGRYADSHKQWDTIRRFRSCFSNQVRSARDANFTPLVLADNKGSGFQRVAVDPCGSLWFQRFMLGCSRRMGQDWRPNQAIGIQIMNQLLGRVEERARESPLPEDRFKWVMAGGYFCICFVLSLRSPEGLMMDLEGLLQFFDPSSDDVIVPLLGRFKGEHHAKQHLLISCATTGSGIQVKLWLSRVMAVHKACGRSTGPAFVNVKGYQSSTSDMNDLFLDVLTEIYEVDPKLFGVDVIEVGDLADKFNVFRSFRRGSESRAVAMKVSEADRYVVNRWKKKESAGAGKVHHAIDQHYVDINMVKESFLRYTAAM